MVLLSESQYCLLSSPVGSDANEFQGQKYFLDAIVGDSFRFGDSYSISKLCELVYYQEVSSASLLWRCCEGRSGTRRTYRIAN